MKAEPIDPPLRKMIKQLFSYAIIGGASNLIGYGIYLLLTYFGFTPKITMSALYFVGAAIGFFANRRFTFSDDGHIGTSGMGYILAHVLGYILNLMILVLCVDWLGFAHHFVQAVAIIVVAVYLFVAFRFFVFSGRRAVRL